MYQGFSWKLHVISSKSQLDLVAVWSKSTSNSMTIPWHLSRFYLFSMPKHDMAFGQVQVMEFPWHLQRNWWDFHWIWSHFRTKPNCRQKDMRKYKVALSLLKMWHGFSHVFLTTVWSKMRPNPMEIPSFSWQIPWKFHDLNLSKIHVMFLHGKQINLDKWHGIVMEFGVDLNQTATKSSCDEKWDGSSMRIHVAFFTG